MTPERLASEAARFAPAFAHLPRPLAAVLVGGGGQYALGAPEIETLTDGLRRLTAEYGAGLLVTASRRTGPQNEALLRSALDGLPAYVWDGSGDNPYFAFLGLADYIIATPDSINMTSESLRHGQAGLYRRFTGRVEEVPDLSGRVAGRRRHSTLRRLIGAVELRILQRHPQCRKRSVAPDFEPLGQNLTRAIRLRSNCWSTADWPRGAAGAARSPCA